MTILDPKDPYVQACFLKMHASLMSKGMKHSKLTQAQVMSQIGQITKKIYKRGQIAIAHQDICDWIEAKKAEFDEAQTQNKEN